MASTRPWQGTALGVLDIIGAVLIFISAIVMIFMQGVMMQMMGRIGDMPAEAADMMPGFLGAGFGAGIGIFLLALGILAIFMARGAFKGQKWSPIVSLIFAILGLLSFLSGLSQGFANEMLISLIINLFTLYCAYICIKAPFYNSK